MTMLFKDFDRLYKPLTRLSWAILAGGLSLVPITQAIATPSASSHTVIKQSQPTQIQPGQTQTQPGQTQTQPGQIQTQPGQAQPDALPIPLAVVQPNGNTITIQLINATGAELNYQVIGDTQFRVLGAQSEATLQDLSIPTTLTFRRTDGGLVTATIETNNSEGTMALILQQTSDFDVDRTALRIEPTGAVYLN